MNIAPIRRRAAQDRLCTEQFDVVVVGGGVTGAGVALDAASRGLKTAIVDKGDWASGTSSKSSKLVHGGLRYLQQREIRLVYENLLERQRLLANAPHLVSVLPFLIPLFAKTSSAGVVADKAMVKAYSSTLNLYDFTGGLRIGKRHQRISAEETLAHMAGLAPTKVAAGFVYYDAQADDARLTLTLIRTAEDYGAVAVNYAEVRALTKSAGKVTGVMLADGTAIQARCVVNATGVWAAGLMELDGELTHRITPAKGVHITVPADRLHCDIAAVVPVRSDRRSLFVVPGAALGAPHLTYIGTTDTPYEGSLEHPTCTADDVKYVLDGMNSWLADPLTPADVTGTWAGLRPLLANAHSERTADLSRRHAVVRARSNLVSILGGKLTTYRKMAEDTVDEVCSVLGTKAKCSTRKLALRGSSGTAELRQEYAALRQGVSPDVLEHLVARHGGEALAVLALLRTDTSLGQTLVPGLTALRAEAVYAARHEHVVHLDDVLARRTRSLLLDRDATALAAQSVAQLIAPELQWTPTDIEAEVAQFTAQVDAERTSEQTLA